MFSFTKHIDYIKDFSMGNLFHLKTTVVLLLHGLLRFSPLRLELPSTSKALICPAVSFSGDLSSSCSQPPSAFISPSQKLFLGILKFQVGFYIPVGQMTLSPESPKTTVKTQIFKLQSYQQQNHSNEVAMKLALYNIRNCIKGLGRLHQEGWEQLGGGGARL